MDRDGWRCRMPVCLNPPENGGRAINPDLKGTYSKWAPSLDHIIRERDGGGNGDENLRAAHRWCNQRHGILAQTGRPPRPDGPSERPPPLQLIGGTDVASRVGPDVYAALMARLEADAAAFREEAAQLDEAGFTERTLDRLAAEPAPARRRRLGWLRRWLGRLREAA